jgi:hypothetical protein
MKKIIIFLTVVALISSCGKEDIPSLKEIRTRLNCPPSQEEIITRYENGIGLKLGLVTPLVGFSIPTNDIYLIEGGLKQVWVWTIISNEIIIEKGIVIIRYNFNFVEVGEFEFIVGWDNEYCIPTTFSSNTKSKFEAIVTLSYPTTRGILSCEFPKIEKDTTISLAQLNYNCAYEIYAGNIVWGKTLNFDPGRLKEKKITMEGPSNLAENGRYLLWFPLQPETKINSKMMVKIYDVTGDTIKHTIVYVDKKDLANENIIGMVNRPKKVSFQPVFYETGHPVLGKLVEKDCHEGSYGGMWIYGF